MNEPVHLKPTENDLHWWMDHFVPDLVLWWWDDSEIPNEAKALRVPDRQGCRHDLVIGDIRYVNAFHTWVMPKDVQRVIVDDGSWINSLSKQDRQHASVLQVRFRRGLCIPHQRFGDDVSFAESVCRDERVVLDQSLWISLPESSKRSVIKSELADWDRDTTYPVPEGTATHITEIANSFILQEGVNCLAVVAYAITGNRNDLVQWMMPDEFSGTLQAAGYVEIGESEPRTDDVIVYRDTDGNIVHAAYAIQPNRILNKNGQTSFNPVAITDLASLQSDWTGYTLAIFRSL